MGCENSKSTDVADSDYGYDNNRNRQQQYAYEGTYVDEPPQQRYQKSNPPPKKGGHVLGGQPVQKGIKIKEINNYRQQRGRKAKKTKSNRG